ncbi:MAG TPA: hypothetical protein VN461_04740 [Vicinamibacteria bacterium]|nr:hypothetical protein [Vicinamibacteria bacterium]
MPDSSVPDPGPVRRARTRETRAVSDKPTTPFDNLESAHEYVRLLVEAIEEAVSAIDEETRRAAGEGSGRPLEALRLVTYKLEKLRGHMTAGRRLLNDLRTLRRLLLGQRLLSEDRIPGDDGSG